jgi:membrane protein DedA with SNARE-associated domain
MPSGQEILDFIISMNSNLITVYLLIAGLMFLNMAILTPPSEFIGVGIGIAVYFTDLNWVLAILIATVFNFLGTLVWYYAGLLRSEKKFKFTYFAEKIDRVEKLYLHNGKALVFLLRFVPFIRALCSYPAGKVRMNLKDFAKYSIPGLMLWMVFWSVLGIFLGQVAIKYHLFFSVGMGIFAYILIKIVLTRFGKKLMSNP